MQSCKWQGFIAAMRGGKSRLQSEAREAACSFKMYLQQAPPSHTDLKLQTS